MKPPKHKGLVDLALENLSKEQLAELRQEVDADPLLAEELAAAKEVLAAMALGLEPEPPASPLKARILGDIRGKNRFLPFLGRLATLFDLSHNQVRACLERLDRPSEWTAILPGVQIIKIQGGPATAGADTNFLRVLPGASFPYHTHRGFEASLLLQGSCRSEGGVINRAGDLIQQEAGSAHSFEVVSEQELIAAVVCFGIAFTHPPESRIKI